MTGGVGGWRSFLGPFGKPFWEVTFAVTEGNLAVPGYVVPRLSGSTLVIFLYELSNRLERVDFGCVFIWSQPKDSGEPESVSTLVALGFLNTVKRDLEHDLRLDDSDSPMRKFAYRMVVKPVGHRLEFRISQSGVGFSNIQ